MCTCGSVQQTHCIGICCGSISAALRLCIHVVMHPCGYASMWLCIHVVMHPCGYASMWLCIHVVMHPCAHHSCSSCMQRLLHLLSQSSHIEDLVAGIWLCFSLGTQQSLCQAMLLLVRQYTCRYGNGASICMYDMG